MNKELLSLNKIIKRFPIDNQKIFDSGQVRDNFFYALDDISFSIEQGECTIIAGANGSGKSLLMTIAAGLEEPTSGKVKTTTGVGLVFQEPDAQILGETPREDIAFGPRNLGLSRKEAELRVEEALSQTGLSQRADFPARSLSGGEKRRLAAAGVLAMNAEIIIFDEPYANMDFPGVVQVNRLFQKLIGDGKTVIILTHELEKCFALCSRFIALSKGEKVLDSCVSEDVLENIENFGIRNPLKNNSLKIEDLLW